jgi:CMP/dCMP kinase
VTRAVVIAVDGTAASGKGTLANKLAQHFGFARLDSGKLYRMVALAVLDANGNPENEADALRAIEAIHPDPLNPAMMGNARLLSQDVSAAASSVAAKPGVRAALLQLQRAVATTPPGGAAGVSIDGRDIGTVVCPDAQAKLFVDARPEVRAHRRWLELKRLWLPGGSPLPAESAILAEINTRDARDRQRMVAPLRSAPDAVLLDTTELDIDAAFAAALALVSPKVEGALKVRHRG